MMNLIDVIEQLNGFGFFTVLMIFVLVVLGIMFTVKTFKEASGLFGKSHRQLMDEKFEQRLIALETRATNLEASAKKFKDDRIHDREQSREYQNEWINVVHDISDKQNQIIERVDSLAEQNRKYQLADMRETLLQAYRYYTSDSTNPSKKWSEMESSSFWEQYKNYKEHGGNGYMESEVAPAMNKLGIVHLDDYEGMSELMSSRLHARC